MQYILIGIGEYMKLTQRSCYNLQREKVKLFGCEWSCHDSILPCESIVLDTSLILSKPPTYAPLCKKTSLLKSLRMCATQGDNISDFFFYKKTWLAGSQFNWRSCLRFNRKKDERNNCVIVSSLFVIITAALTHYVKTATKVKGKRETLLLRSKWQRKWQSAAKKKWLVSI